MAKQSTYKIWEGTNPNGQSIMATLSSVNRPSSNRKTGDMAQLSVLSSHTKPSAAIKARTDSDFCGTCPLQAGKGCYVNPIAYNAVHKAATGLPVTPLPEFDKPIRLGAYGDPGFIPLPVLKTITANHRWTGYTHQWLTVPPGYSHFLMASVDGIRPTESRANAKRLGYRTFRTLSEGQSPEEGEIMCPNITHNGVSCATCLLCSGTSHATAKDICIPAHGSKGKINFINNKNKGS